MVATAEEILKHNGIGPIANQRTFRQTLFFCWPSSPLTLLYTGFDLGDIRGETRASDR
jgi:hypothetical protein